MNKKLSAAAVLIALLGTSIPVTAQVKFWVKFTDKNGTPYSVSTPSAFLTQASITRRNNANIQIDQTDLPVNPSYISQVENLNNVTVVYASKWLNGVVVSVPSASVLSSVTSLSFVANTSPVNRYHLDIPDVKPVDNTSQNSYFRTAGTATTAYNYGGSYWQNHQLNVDCLHEKGMRGQGIVIAVLDAGFDGADTNPMFDTIRAQSHLLGTRDFVDGGTNVYHGSEHGTEVLSCIAANKPGVILGSAPMASFWLLRTEDASSEKIIEEYNWIRGAEFADSVGARVLTTSLGYTDFDNNTPATTYTMLTGRIAPMSIAATMASRKGMFVLNAAGNEGANSWHYVGVPADADSICTVGAVDSLANYAGFSSVGPTADGRIKPDLVARGVGAWVCGPTGFCFPGNGTSFATPVLAGAVACFINAHPGDNNMQLLNLMKQVGSNVSSPNNFIGWGLPKLCAISVGINEVKPGGPDFDVFPNPFNSFITINLKSSDYTVSAIELCDVVGKTLLKEMPGPSTTSSIQINTGDLPAGIYFVKLRTQQGTAIRKIIK